MYSESDLFKLERIIALKFFGFSLSKIKKLIRNDEEVLNHLKFQISFLDEQIKELNHARHIAHDMIAQIDAHKEIDWSYSCIINKCISIHKRIK